MGKKSYRRRDFLKAVGFGSTALAIPGSLMLACGSTRARKPNIVLIMSDDQGWADIHSHGNPMLDTPVMDRLAASGTRLDRFFVSPVCAPTRAGLLTGRYPLRTGTTGVTRGRETMRSDEITIAQVLKTAGYTTACFGKWHNGAHYPYHPNGKGFDQFLGFCAGHWNNYFDTQLDQNGEPVRTQGYITDVLTDAAMAFIDKNRNRPFFCYLPYNAPHSPYQLPKKYFDKYRSRGADDELASVYGMIENLDDNLGRLLQKLDELKLAEDTIVIFIGDNGAGTERFNAGMRGRKGSTHEGGIRVPCFIRWPGHIQAGSNTDRIAAHIDLLPTLVELAGVQQARTLPLDGISLVPLLLGESENWPDRMIFTGFRNRGSVRTQRYRLVVQEEEPVELFDMAADPGQLKNIAGERPEITSKLKQAYDEWHEEVTGPGLEVPPVPVGHRQRKLVELPAHEGHLEGGVKYQGVQGWANDWVTGWTDIDMSVYWDIDVVREGSYEVTLMYTCSQRELGSKMCVQIASERLEGIVEKAHDPAPVPSPDRVKRKEVYEKIWAPLTLGTVRLEKRQTRLYVKALNIPANSALDLKAVRIRQLD